MGPRTRATRYANHPMIKYVRSLEQEFYLGREVAELVGCSLAYLTYLRRHSPTPMGPTHRAQYGATVLHLYTPERIEQIAAFMKQITGGGGGRKRRGPPTLWTRTERAVRRREFDQARTYRNRSVIYRQEGNEAAAVDMDKRAIALIAKLEKARAARHKQIHG